MSCACKIGGGPDGVCGFCRHRAATNERLKKLEDAKATADYERGIAEGERRERARVVAWLRERLIVGADRIERGEHTKEGA